MSWDKRTPRVISSSISCSFLWLWCKVSPLSISGLGLLGKTMLSFVDIALLVTPRVLLQLLSINSDTLSKGRCITIISSIQNAALRVSSLAGMICL